MKSKCEQAMDYFHSGFNCAQSVLTPFGADYGLSEEHCLKVACAFGAGMGRQQHTCGAVTGALMALGLHYGKGRLDDNAKKLDTYEKTRSFFKVFSEKHGSIGCLELLGGLRMENPADMRKIEEMDLHNTRCTMFVCDAVEMTENILKK